VIELAELRKTLQSERSGAQEKLALTAGCQASAHRSIQGPPNEILEERFKRFTEQNQSNLGALLDPLKLKITEFHTKIEDNYVKEGRDRTALGEQVRQLMELNQHLSEDAKNLTRALRGSSKAPGHPGRMDLGEGAGGFRTSQGRGIRGAKQPHPRGWHPSAPRCDRSISAKAGVWSLTLRSRSSRTKSLLLRKMRRRRAAAGKRHMESIRGHIKGLSGKNYRTLYSLTSLDFGLLFVPIEPAFMLAVASDGDLFMDAWNRNVLLVSPSTLLFVVRTVAHLLRQEAQSRNAEEIAKRGA
jgi:DNA recombination protein RmuC